MVLGNCSYNTSRTANIYNHFVVIKIINLETKKRPVSVVADNVEVRNIKSVQIKINNLIKFKLLYDRNSILTKKIKLEQIRKETI